MSINPVARQKDLVVQEMPDEVLVYDMNTNKAHCLNPSAAFVWRACNGNNSVEDIVRDFESNGKGKVTEDFVWLAIDQLHENSLLENEIVPRFAGQSRREVIKTIGLASMVAVPVIASLVAPQNALAAGSCACVNPAGCAGRVSCPSTTICNSSGQCAPN
ncbi:MAG: PqqD family protein [Pyrinomonadaceae bacterium]